jgi:hypothetical protein
MNNITLDILVNVLFGAFACAGGFLVLFYRKNLALYKGVAILLFALGISSCITPFLSETTGRALFILYFLSRIIVPIFLVVFSEYILKIRYHIIAKLLLLTASWCLAIGSFFQHDTKTWYANTSDFFFLAVVVFILVKLVINVASLQERLLKKYVWIFFVTLILLMINELVRFDTINFYNPYSMGVSALIVTHGVILIITSGGSSRLKQKLSTLLNILMFNIMLCALLEFFHAEIEFKHLASLFVLSISFLSIYYLVKEVSKNPKEIGSALLISRLLSLPLHDKKRFLEELRQWEEINALHFIDHTTIEGSVSGLHALFNSTGGVIHKNQIAPLGMTTAFNPGVLSGIEVAQFYFRKFDCQSLFQISQTGDFIAVQYVKGLNPVLYANELSLMTKIVFSANASKTT